MFVHLVDATLDIILLKKSSNHHIEGGVIAFLQLVNYYLYNWSCTHIANSIFQNKQLLNISTQP
jgi:hypothetical protein